MLREGGADFLSRLRREKEREGMALRSHLALDDLERSAGPLTIPTHTAPLPIPPLRTLGTLLLTIMAIVS